MRCSRRLLEATLAACTAALAGCGAIAEQAPGSLAVREARIAPNGDAATLALGLDCRLSGPMQDALEHGIPLTLRIDVGAGAWPRRPSASTRLELRYFPLSRRYQLRELGREDVSSYATPGYLIAALGSLRLGLPKEFVSLPAATRLHVSAALDPAALPGALRLPALFEPAWRLSSPDYAWTPAGR